MQFRLVAAAPPSPAASPTYLLAPRTARPFETPLATASATGPQVTVSVIGLRVHLLSIIGTHAEWLPHGRVRAGPGRPGQREVDVPSFSVDRLLLVDANGTTYKPDYDAMNIARQPRSRPSPPGAGWRWTSGSTCRSKSIVRALRVQDLGKDIALPGS